MSPNIEIQLIGILVAIACSLPGVFLILRKMAMMTDSITHTILLGIVIAFFITESLTSPFLVIGAALMGVFTVILTELLNSTGLVSEDSAIGIVFPLLFSIAIIIISRYAGSIALDTDSVLLGQIEFAPFDRLVVNGKDIGAKSVYLMGTILVMNLIYVIMFFKELKIVTFDPALATVLGISPVLIHYSLMGLVSITAVGAFEAVGSILVIAFMIGPPVTAYLLTDDLKKMIVISSIIGGLNGLIGYRFAVYYDVSIAGSMAMITGIVFLLVFIFAPRRGLLTTLRRREIQKIQFAGNSFLFHILNHESEEDGKVHNSIEYIKVSFNWEDKFLENIIEELEKQEKIIIENNIVKLTELGREDAIKNYEEIVEGLVLEQ